MFLGLFERELFNVAFSVPLTEMRCHVRLCDIPFQGNESETMWIQADVLMIEKYFSMSHHKLHLVCTFKYGVFVDLNWNLCAVFVIYISWYFTQHNQRSLSIALLSYQSSTWIYLWWIIYIYVKNYIDIVYNNCKESQRGYFSLSEIIRRMLATCITLLGT